MSNAHAVGPFKTGFDTGNLHRLTLVGGGVARREALVAVNPFVKQVQSVHNEAAQAEVESKVLKQCLVF